MAALALGDEHPTLAHPQVLEAQPEHLTAAQGGAQDCDELVHRGRLEDAGQQLRCAHQRCRPAVVPPARRVSRPRGTGLVVTPASPPASR